MDLGISFPATIRNIAIFNIYSGTSEIPKSLLLALRLVHPHPERITCVPSYALNDETTLYIIICPAGLGSERQVQGPKYYITYQVDPTSILEREPYRKFLQGALYNWDYSQKNVAKLAEYGITSLYVPPGCTPTISMPEILNGSYLYSDEGKDIDVLFLGYADAYERRRKLQDTLYLSGLRIWFTFGLNLEGMQAAIHRAKICLNMHVLDNMPCLETLRLNILLSNQACVVSEDITDPEVDIYKDYITCVPYDKLVETCVKLRGDAKYRREKAIKSYQWYRTKRDWNRLVDFTRLLPQNLV